MNNGLKVIKRSSDLHPFDPDRIQRAVYRCMFNGMLATPELSGSIAEDVTSRVLNILTHRDATPVHVEEIQNLVEQQLMAAGLYEAAKKYILYREEHRRQREEIPIDSEVRKLFEADRLYFPHPIQQFQFYDKYSRWRPELGRRETWVECVERAIGFMQEYAGDVLTPDEWAECRQSILTMEAMPSMRLLQMAGPAARRCNVGIYNCAFVPIDSLSSWSELLYILMQGTGCGFSVEDDYVSELPRVRKIRKTSEVGIHVVEDTTEGWCESLRIGIERWFAGDDIQFNYDRIRPQGAILKTKGGRASGPEPLRQLLDYTRAIIRKRAGRILTAADCHRIACMCGQIVQVGGVRRAAEISLSDLWDVEMRDIKRGAYWDRGDAVLCQANNSAVYEERPNDVDFMEEWLSLARSGSGERGIFNRAGVLRTIPKRRRKRKFGVNPCGEIVLRARQFCNLSIAVARAGDTEEDLIRKVRMAAFFGTIQSLMTDFSYLPDDWRRNCEEERLLGVDITGQLDCELLQPQANALQEELRLMLFEKLQQTAVDTNKWLAERFGIHQSAAVTCVKPGGNSSWLLFCSSGLSPRYGLKQVRRVRVGAFTPMAKVLKAAGVPWHPENDDDPANPSTLVFEFLAEAPEGSMVKEQMTALQQLDNWLKVKKHYTEHNPSVTIYVGEDEWFVVGLWILTNWDWVGGLSFLPRDNGLYRLAPNEIVPDEEFERRKREFPEIDFSRLIRYETEDMTSGTREFACTGDRCEL
jgi:ribonucleoside-triphosphate reductase